MRALLLLPLLAAAACGAPYAMPSVTGALGSKPLVTVPTAAPDPEPHVEVLHEGDGPVVEPGQVVVTHVESRLWKSGKPWLNTWDIHHPTTAILGGKQLAKTWDDALVGKHAGSRVMLVAPAAKAFSPSGLAPVGAEPSDTMVLVFDIIGGYDPKAMVKVAPGTTAGPGMPKLNGVASLLSDFPAKPPSSLTVRVLRRGTGPVVRPGSTIVTQYVTSQWGVVRPFDASYMRGGPTGFIMRKDSALPGWLEGLNGIPAGSRVLLVVPPAYAKGFKGTSGGLFAPRTGTAAHVIDILDVS
ncbi:FKBP-type peptidyl-prolyl cis-trans isomerase [Nonomuraea sp. NPDC050556]|uniref:FKBP-type peptidyl-prolyl cis-trans isomerase n=1 Tax=Nonomuraea sp. NPDC050556 TaxID=3364369 RepID=UPI00378C3C4F